MATAENPRRDNPGDWRVSLNKPASSPVQKEQERQQLLLIVSVVILFVLGAVVGFAFWFRPVPLPRFISLSVSQYTSDWPLNPNAEADAAHLEQGFPRSADLPLQTKPKEQKEKDFNNQDTKEKMTRTIKDWLAKDSATALIHISALAIVRNDVVYLVPAEANPNPKDPAKEWLPLSELIEIIKEGRGRNKLLLLDLAHPQAGSLKHELIQEAATLANEYLEKITSNEELNFNVLVSCSPGELSYPLTETGTSVFMHYIVKGLQGGANGYLSAEENDTVITVKELAGYVADHVYLWTKTNLDCYQTPRLYGSAPEFYVALTTRDSRSNDKDPEDEAPKGPPYPPALINGWKKRDAWLNAGVGNVAPQLVSQLEGALLRAEAFWMYRDPTGAMDQLNLPNFDKYYKKIPDYMLALPAMRRLSVTLTDAVTSADKSGENQASTQWQEMRRLEREAAQKPDDKSLKAKAEERWNQIKSSAKAVKSRELYAQFYWQTLVADRECYDRFDKIEELFHNELRYMDTKYAQVGWLLNLKDQLKFKIHRNENTRELGYFLCSRHEQLIRTVALLEPTSLPWVKTKLEDALKEHRQLELDVFNLQTTPTDITRFRDKFNKLEKGYIEIEQIIRRINTSTAHLNRSLSFINNTTEHFWEGLHTQSSLQSTWTQLLEKTKSLFDRLSTPRPQTGEEIDSDTRDVAIALDILRQNYRTEEAKRAVVAAEQDKVWPPKEHKNLDWLLLGPWLAADDRKLVWEAKRTLALGYHQRRISEDLKQQNNKPRQTKVDPFVPKDPMASEYGATELRYKIASVLLTLSGVEAGPKLEQSTPRIDDAKAWREAGQQLRYAPEYLPKLLQLPGEMTTLGRDIDADLALRLIPYSIRADERDRLLDQFTVSPHYRGRTIELARWLHDQFYQPMREHLKNRSEARDFYNNCATELRLILNSVQSDVR